MDNNVLLEFLRDLAKKLRIGNVPNLDAIAETLQMAQDHLALIYQDYENDHAPDGAELLRELMMEALQLMFLGIDEFFHYLENQVDSHLTEGLAMAEEGNDILSSIKHSVENNQEWTGSASLG